LTEFFGNCTHLYGSSGCQISHVAVHYYSCKPASTQAYLKSIHDAFEKPIWLSEFACGDASSPKNSTDQIAFMREMLPFLDKTDYIYRYAWMALQLSSTDPRSLVSVASGQAELTDVGKAYATL
jgi:hypothetical protein